MNPGVSVVTVAEDICVESISVMATIGDTVVAVPVVPIAVGAVTTSGAAATGSPTNVTIVVPGVLDWPDHR